MSTEVKTDPAESRRTFLKIATNALGAVVGLLLGIPAIAYLIDARNRAAAQSDYKPVARLSELTVNQPQEVVIRDIQRDAWTTHPNEIVGRVWLIRRPGDKLEAFSTICPHLGCSINFEASAHLFVCPCHGGTFNEDGTRQEVPGKVNPPPRGMDKLECRRSPENPDIIEVKYQTFMAGKEEAIPRA
jgi:Rieske Fe-S protein